MNYININYLIIYFALTLILVLFMTIKDCVKNKKIQTLKRKFTTKNYHTLLMPSVIAIIIYSIIEQTINPIILFTIFSIAGIIGETAFSLWWHQYYKERFWTYTTKTKMNKYTSTLNFLAWSIGGILFLTTLNYTPTTQKETPLLYITLFSFIAIAQLIIFHTVIKRKLEKNKFQKVTHTNFIFYTAPIWIPLLILIKTQGNEILIIFLALGIIGAITEYLLGKFLHETLSRKLWTYNYLSYDEKHFTPLSIPAFSLAGIYFWMITEIFFQITPFI